MEITLDEHALLQQEMFGAKTDGQSRTGHGKDACRRRWNRVNSNDPCTPRILFKVKVLPSRVVQTPAECGSTGL